MVLSVVATVVVLECVDFALRCLQALLQCSDSGEQDGRPEGSQDGCHKVGQDGRCEEPDAKRVKLHSAELGGLVFATCCHHRCSWDSYCGRGYLEGWGLTDVDFCLITKMSSWAVCGCRPRQQEQDGHHDTLSSDEEDQLGAPLSNDPSNEDSSPSIVGQGYSPHPREAVGLLCKRLIDEGRVWFLRQLGLQAELVAYVERGVSLENMLIAASAVQPEQLS